MSDPTVLLGIIDKARQWPNLQSLHDLAMDDLKRLNDDAKVELDKRAAAAAKVAADAQAKADAEAKAKADALKTANVPKAVING